jgi:Domain of unknown function (DUF4190)
MSGPPGDEQQGQQPSWQQPESQQPQWQQPESQQPQWGQQQQQYQPQSTPGSATAALILGICALLVCPIICAPLALVYGNKARNEIDGSGGRLGGRGMATAGIVLGWIGIAWAVLWVIYIIVVVAASSS